MKRLEIDDEVAIKELLSDFGKIYPCRDTILVGIFFQLKKINNNLNAIFTTLAKEKEKK